MVLLRSTLNSFCVPDDSVQLIIYRALLSLSDWLEAMTSIRNKNSLVLIIRE